MFPGCTRKAAARVRVRTTYGAGDRPSGWNVLGTPPWQPVQLSGRTARRHGRLRRPYRHLVSLFRKGPIDALITDGGDGSLAIGQRLFELTTVIGVPKTSTTTSTRRASRSARYRLVEVATESIYRVFTTATSHSRVFVVEVMGRYAGWIALNAGVRRRPRDPDPRDPVRPRAGCGVIKSRERVVPALPSLWLPTERFRGMASGQWSGAFDQAKRLGGVGHAVAQQLTQLTGREAITVVLGHLCAAELQPRTIACGHSASGRPPCAPSKEGSMVDGLRSTAARRVRLL